MLGTLAIVAPTPTRVETHCLNDLLNVPRWRRSKFSTAKSTPPRAALATLGDTPAACASAEKIWMKVLKSPPQRAAWEVVARRTKRRSAQRVKVSRSFSIWNRFLGESAGVIQGYSNTARRF